MLVRLAKYNHRYTNTSRVSICVTAWWFARDTCWKWTLFAITVPETFKFPNFEFINTICSPPVHRAFGALGLFYSARVTGMFLSPPLPFDECIIHWYWTISKTNYSFYKIARMGSTDTTVIVQRDVDIVSITKHVPKTRDTVLMDVTLTFKCHCVKVI